MRRELLPLALATLSAALVATFLVLFLGNTGHATQAPPTQVHPGLTVKVVQTLELSQGRWGQRPASGSYVVLRVEVTGYGLLDPENFSLGGYPADFTGNGATGNLLGVVTMHGNTYAGDIAFDAPLSVEHAPLRYDGQCRVEQ